MVHKQTGMDWDDIRYFLAVSRTGSIRSAATLLAVNHSTVSRRIGQLEKQLGVRLFEKLPTGYLITPAGDEILDLTERMEEQVNELERKVYGRDAGLSGKLRITLPQILATHLLMPDLVQFARANPGIELEIISSYETLNLTRRQADVAIRLVYDNQTPPEHLYGRKLASVYRSVYVSKKMRLSSQPDAEVASICWVVKEEDGPLPAWVIQTYAPAKDSIYLVSDLFTQLAATREGLGASILPCYLGDNDPELERLTPGQSKLYGTLWVLTHGDIRNTPRVRIFTEFIAEVIRSHTEVLKGIIT
jgi:DNA-binding transcriptional LysR family regulator